MLTIRNARVIDPASGTDALMDVTVEGGRIREMTPVSSDPAIEKTSAVPATQGPQDAKTPVSNADETIDAAGAVLAPGLIDTHVHFRDPGFPHKETIETGARAAKAGGFTSVIMMANTAPCPDDPEKLRAVLDRAGQFGIHIYSCANVTKDMAGKEPVDMEALARAGAAGFTDDGKPLTDEALLNEVFQRAAALGLPISLHEEAPDYVWDPGVNAGGKAAAHLGLRGADRQAEIRMVDKDLERAIRYGTPLCIQHVSAAETVELLRQARHDYPELIHAEATPQHFSLTEDAVLERGTLAKVNPPLRLSSDREAIRQGLADGALDLIATDHAPHSAAEKALPFPKAPSGMIGLETALGLGIRALVNEGYLTLSELLRKMTVNPAAFYHLEAGRIAPDAPADLVLFDPAELWTVPETFYSMACNSPFIGEVLPGRIRMTIAEGRVVYGK